MSKTDATTPATELAWLLRLALGVHRAEIARSLAQAGHAPLPPLALWSLDALAARGQTAGELASLLSVTKQAVSQVVELLATRGYLERTPDAQDRRRVTLTLTERGRGAAAAIASACANVESRALAALGADGLARAREALSAIAPRVPV